MRHLSSIGPARPVALVGLFCGAVVGIAAALLAGTATAHQVDASPQGVLEAAHNPPLLTLRGEPLELSYDVYCAPARVEDPEQVCDVSGSVFVRPPDAAPTESSRSSRRRRVASGSS